MIWVGTAVVSAAVVTQLLIARSRAAAGVTR